MHLGSGQGKVITRAVVVAEQLLPIPEVGSSDPVKSNILYRPFVYSQP